MNTPAPYSSRFSNRSSSLRYQSYI
jgi:hypothetical protein